MTPKILCKYDELVSVSSLAPFKKNRNQHTPEQIERLGFLIESHGMRSPVVVAAAPFNCIAKGHGTVMAFKSRGWDKVPVVYQEFESEEQLYTYCQSDNAIQAWAELDLSGIHKDLPELEPFDVDLLGIKDFRFEPEEAVEGEQKQTLEDKFLVPPFSVLDARQGYWQDRKRMWLAMGIQSELGRGGASIPGADCEQTGTTEAESGKRKAGNDVEFQVSKQAKPNTIGAIPPNQKDILRRKGKYA